MPIIGNISLARDMKTALQEADDAEGEDEQTQTPRVKDAKGREILSPEEKAKKEEKDRIKAEKDRQKSAEASTCTLFLSRFDLHRTLTWGLLSNRSFNCTNRKQQREPNE